MRKDKWQQKYRQLELFSSEPDGNNTGGTSKEPETGVELSSRLEQQRALTTTILERVVDYMNLDKAYRQVRANGGSSGRNAM